MRFRSISLAALVAALLVHVATASAQGGGGSPSDEQIAEARARFLTGSEAAAEGRWADAAVEFERAYELARVPPALYNLGIAFRGLGRYLESRRALDLLLARHRTQLDPQMLSDAERVRQEVAARVAALELIGLDPDASYELRLDGRLTPDERRRPWVLETDPGAHSLIVTRVGYERFTWDGELAPGARERVEVAMDPLPEPSAIVGTAGDGHTATPPPEDDGGVLSSPAFWIVVTAVVLAGAGAALYFALRDDGQLEPESDMPVRVP